MAQGTAVHGELLPAPWGARRSILIVDESAKDRNYVGEILRTRGYEVVACGSVLEGACALEQRRFDFVMVSQGSPAFEGRSILERVVEIDRTIPVIVLTRCVEMSCYIDAMQLGAVDYLEKPISPAEILRLVETHLRPIPMVA